MKKTLIISLLLLLIFAACGDNSPFDEDYWEDPNVISDDENSNEELLKFSVNLLPLIEATVNMTGSVKITVNQSEVTQEMTLTQVPQSLMIGQRSLTTLTCAEVLATSPTPQAPNDAGESKDITFADEGTLEALIAELIQADPQNGNAINLVGKQFVVKAYVSNLNSPNPQAASLIPIACGTIVVDNSGNGTSGGSSGGTTGGTTGGTSGGTSGGTTGGTTTGGTTTGGF